MCCPVRLPFLGALYLLPTLIMPLVERTRFSQGLALSIYGLACYFTVAHYLQVQLMWKDSLLANMRAIGKGDLGETATAGKLGGQFMTAHAHHARKVIFATLAASSARNAAPARRRVAAVAGEISGGNANPSRRTEQGRPRPWRRPAAGMEELCGHREGEFESCATARVLARQRQRGGGQGRARWWAAVGAHHERASTQGSKKVMKSPAVIEGIAFQTNILALNAAVEAATRGSSAASPWSPPRCAALAAAQSAPTRRARSRA